MVEVHVATLVANKERRLGVTVHELLEMVCNKAATGKRIASYFSLTGIHRTYRGQALITD
jgi:hypothetical protein